MNKILKASTLGLFVATSFWACTEESSANYPGTNYTVSSLEDLPNCTSTYEGSTAYITGEESIYECADRKWIFSEGTSSNGSTDGLKPSGYYSCSKYTCAPTDQLNQSMLKNGKYQEFLDKRNNTVYKVVTIGDQVWFAQNLNYVTHDGYADDGYGSQCLDDTPANCKKYGRLYTWAAVMNVPEKYNTTRLDESDVNYQGLCPNGWHVPSYNDWETLRDQPGFSASAIQSAMESSWYGDDDFGFSIVKSEMYGYNKYSCNESFYWLSTESSYGNAKYWVTGKSCEGTYGTEKTEKFALRCLQDDPRHIRSSSSVAKSSSSSVRSSSSSVRSSSSVPKYTYDIEDLVDFSVTNIKKSGYYDCTEHKCLPTKYLNKDLLSEGKYYEYLDTRDDQVYKVISIGDQVWMAQNLNRVTDGGYADDEVGSRCYLDIKDSCAARGRFYTWTAAMNIDSSYTGLYYSATGKVQGICPKGWHLPSDDEWDKLASFVYTSEGAGAHLKSKFSDGYDTYGFSGLVTGKYHIDSGRLTWDEKQSSFFWTTTEYSATRAYYRILIDSRDDFISYEFDNSKRYFVSVRCLAD